MHTGRSPCLTFPVSELQQSRCSAGDVRGDHGGVHSRVENEADGKGTVFTNIRRLQDKGNAPKQSSDVEPVQTTW